MQVPGQSALMYYGKSAGRNQENLEPINLTGKSSRIQRHASPRSIKECKSRGCYRGGDHVHSTPATEVVSGWRSEDFPPKPLTALDAPVTHSFDWSPTPGSTTALCHCRPVLLSCSASDKSFIPILVVLIGYPSPLNWCSPTIYPTLNAVDGLRYFS